jgi:hypothetical protein
MLTEKYPILSYANNKLAPASRPILAKFPNITSILLIPNCTSNIPWLPILINWVSEDVVTRVNLLKLFHVGLNFFEKFLKMLWVNWVLKGLRKIEFHIDNGMWFV